VDNNSLKAEVSGNTVLKDGTVSVGNSPAVSNGSMTGAPSAGPPDGLAEEPNRSGHIHLHPASGPMKVRIENSQGVGVVDITGGKPSPGDVEQHQRDYQNHQAKNGVRSIAVDSKNIYLYNSIGNQILPFQDPNHEIDYNSRSNLNLLLLWFPF
jgi:hypothetical protein